MALWPLEKLLDGPLTLEKLVGWPYDFGKNVWNDSMTSENIVG